MLKNLFLLSCLTLLSSGLFAVTTPPDIKIEAFIRRNEMKDALRKQNLQPIFEAAIRQFKGNKFSDSSKIFDATHNIQRNAAVILVFNPLNKGSLDETEVKKIVCTRGTRKDGKLSPVISDYLLEKKNILLIFIGATVNTKDLKIKLEDSYFENSFNELKDVATLVLGAGQDTSTYPGRMVYYGSKEIKTPCTISMSVPIKKPILTDSIFNKNLSFLIKSSDQDLQLPVSPGQIKLNFDKTDTVQTTVKLKYYLGKVKHEENLSLDNYYFYKDEKTVLKQKVHEKNYFAFSLGASLSQLNLKQVSMKNDTIKVALDSASKKSWKAHLLVGLEWYPCGRDIDNFLPIWKAPFKNLQQRVGLMGGISLSKDPLSSCYYGICLSLSKGLSITAGFNYTSQFQNQLTYVPNAVSLDDAKQYLKREYERNIYFGIFLAPSQMAKTLGLKKK